MNLSEELMYNTVRIEGELPNGKRSIGTGFIFLYLFDEHKIPVIVTNKHVIKETISGRFVLHLDKDYSNNPLIQKNMGFEFDKFEDRWIKHPDEEVDLCIMLLAPLQLRAQKENVKFFYRSISEELIPTEKDLEDIGPMEPISMIGYPIGLWDEVNNYPIFRTGITATHPRYNHNGKEEFLIDIASFPGSSGSPIFLMNIGSYNEKRTLVIGKNRIKFLGISYSGYLFDTEGEIILKDISRNTTPLAITKIPVNLAIVIKAKKLLDFKPILKEMLEKELKSKKYENLPKL